MTISVGHLPTGAAGFGSRATFFVPVLRLSDLLHSVHPSKCSTQESTLCSPPHRTRATYQPALAVPIPDSAPLLPTGALGDVEPRSVVVRPGCSSPARTHTLSQQEDEA